MLPDQAPPEDELEGPPPGRAARFVPWLFVLGLALLFIPVYLASGAIDETTAPLSTESASLQLTITSPPPVPSDEAALAEQLLSLRSQLGAIEDIPPTLIATHIDWPAIMEVIRSYDADMIRLSGLNNQSGQLILDGTAMQEGAVLDYTHALERTGYFSRVTVQTITVNPSPPPTVVPTDTGDSTASLPVLYMPFIFTLSIDLNGAAS
jgi:hypothetical protein